MIDWSAGTQEKITHPYAQLGPVVGVASVHAQWVMTRPEGHAAKNTHNNQVVNIVLETSRLLDIYSRAGGGWLGPWTQSRSNVEVVGSNLTSDSIFSPPPPPLLS